MGVKLLFGKGFGELGRLPPKHITQFCVEENVLCWFSIHKNNFGIVSGIGTVLEVIYEYGSF